MDHVFSEVELYSLEPFEQAIKEAVIARNNALTVILRMNKLEGNWSLSPDGKKLIKAEEGN